MSDDARASDDGLVYRLVRVSGRFCVRFAIDAASEDPIDRFMLANNTYADPPLDLFVSLLRPGMRVIDVGAHIGSFSLAAAAAGCRVIAVEAAASNVRLLRAAAAHSAPSDLQVIHAAVSDHDGIVDFSADQAWGHVAWPGDKAEGLTPAQVPSLTLASVVESAGWPGVDLIKIDIEGGEAAAIGGAAGLLGNAESPSLLIEVNGPRLGRFGSSESALRAQLAALGYALMRVDRRNPRRLAPRSPEDAEYEAVADYLAVKAPWEDRPPGWKVAPWSMAEELRQAQAALEVEWPPHRAFSAAAVLAAPAWVRSRRGIRTRLRRLRADPDAAVRAAAAGSFAQTDVQIEPLGARLRRRIRRLVGRSEAPGP